MKHDGVNRNDRVSSKVGAIAFVCVLCHFPSAWAQECGPLRNHYGPYDYRTASEEQRRIVEVDGRHFTPDVEYLRKGETGPLGSELSYTLRVFPNHHRALASMSKFAQRQHTRKPTNSHFTIDCWFDRAIRFAPSDPAVYLLYGIDLLRIGKRQEAVKLLEKSLELSGDDPNAQYNLGLAYFELGDFEKSLAFAKKAYANGFPLQGLKNKLQRAGKWRD